MTKEKIHEVITSKAFKIAIKIIGAVFLVLTYFITITPDSFLKFSYFGIFVFNIISSGLLLMPVLTHKFNLAGVILVSALGNIPNTAISYLLGSSSSGIFTNVGFVTTIKLFMKKFGLYAVYILAVIPLPIDINGLLSGYLGIPFWQYILVNFLGKMTIFFLVGLGIITLTKV